MVILAVIASAIVTIQDPFVQYYAVRTASGYLSEKTDSKIQIGNFKITPEMKVEINNLLINDLEEVTLIDIGSLRLNVHHNTIINRSLHLGKIELSDVIVNLIIYENQRQFNYQHLADFFSSSDTTSESSTSSFKFKANHLVGKNMSFVYWDQNNDSIELLGTAEMDYAHIDVRDIILDATDITFEDGTLDATVNLLAAKEVSGLDLKFLRSDISIAPKNTILNNTEIILNNSQIDLNFAMEYSGIRAFNNYIDSVRMIATILPSEIQMADIGYFSLLMHDMVNVVNIEGNFDGTVEDFTASDFHFSYGSDTRFHGSISMKGLPYFFSTNSKLNVDHLYFSYDDLSNFAIPIEGYRIPLPTELAPIGKCLLTGEFIGSYYNFNTDLKIQTEVGDINTSISMSDNKTPNAQDFSITALSSPLQIGKLTSLTDYLNLTNIEASVEGKYHPDGSMELSVTGDLSNVDVMKSNIDRINLQGRLSNDIVEAEITTDDDDINLNLLASYHLDNEHLKVSLELPEIHLNRIGLVDSHQPTLLSTTLDAEVKSFDINKMTGFLSLKNTCLTDKNGKITMNNFHATLDNDSYIMRKLLVDCDFLNLEMAGIMNFAELYTSLQHYVTHYISITNWENPNTNNSIEQDFFLNLTLKNTTPLTRMFMPLLMVSNNTSLRGTFTSTNQMLNMALRSDKVSFNGMQFKDIQLKTRSNPRFAIADLAIKDIILRDSTNTDPTILGLDNFSIVNYIQNDSIVTNISWNDMKPIASNSADITTKYVINDNGNSSLNIKHLDLTINDSTWQISPDNYISFDKGHVAISDFCFTSGNNSIELNGSLPFHYEDTLLLRFQNFNLSSFDILTANSGIDLNGFVNGHCELSNLNQNPTILADLGIKDLMLNGQQYGDAEIHSFWDNPKNAIFLDAEINDNGTKRFNLTGMYSPHEDNDSINMVLTLDKLNLGVSEPFLKGIISQTKGFIDGRVHIAGSLTKPDIYGRISMYDAGCKIDYTNTYYNFNNILDIKKDRITLNSMSLTDPNGNTTSINGYLTHNYFSDIEFNIQLMPQHFMALNTTAKDNKMFYGSVFVNGFAELKGSLNDITLNTQIATEKNTKVTVPLDYASTVSSNDFILFIDPLLSDTLMIEEEQEISSSNINVNADVHITDEANIKIILPNNMGQLEASGNGDLRVSSSSDELSLYGEYIIKDGKFNITFENIMRKNFDLESGGRISWSGDPMDGKIDAAGIYHTKAPISSLGIEVDSSSMTRSNVNVDCIIRLQNSLLNPNITFGIRLPNASDDVQQAIYSVLDTANQAVMTQQIVSLLVLNSFTYAGNTSNNVLASNYFDVITGQLSGWLSQISRDFDIGINYKPGDEISNEELQIALKTQLFNNYLTIESNFGMVNSGNGNASSLVGDVDVYVKLSKNGRLNAHIFNHSNNNTYYYNYTFDKLSPYTQGIGLSYSHDFDRFRDIFRRRRKNKVANKPIIGPTTQQQKTTEE